MVKKRLGWVELGWLDGEVMMELRQCCSILILRLSSSIGGRWPNLITVALMSNWEPWVETGKEIVREHLVTL